MKRRKFIVFALSLPLLLSAKEQARKISFEFAYNAFVGNTTVLKNAKIVALNIPKEPPTGKSVPVEVSVDYPMKKDDYIESITVLPTQNPVCRAVEFNLTPMNGRAYLACNIKLATSQKVVVLVRSSKGKIYEHAQEVHVALSGCA